jgi:hypothetical protein
LYVAFFYKHIQGQVAQKLDFGLRDWFTLLELRDPFVNISAHYRRLDNFDFFFVPPEQKCNLR